MSQSSEAIVSFIANLLPVYDGVHHSALYCARSLEDGTLVQPVSVPDEDPDHSIVRVLWQGDPARSQEVEGIWIASIALVRYIELHGVGESDTQRRNALEFYANHFHHKTGHWPYLPMLPGTEAPMSRLPAAVRRFKENVLTSLLLKAFGM